MLEVEFNSLQKIKRLPYFLLMSFGKFFFLGFCSLRAAHSRINLRLQSQNLCVQALGLASFRFEKVTQFLYLCQAKISTRF